MIPLRAALTGLLFASSLAAASSGPVRHLYSDVTLTLRSPERFREAPEPVLRTGFCLGQRSGELGVLREKLGTWITGAGARSGERFSLLLGGLFYEAVLRPEADSEVLRLRVLSGVPPLNYCPPLEPRFIQP